MEKIDLTIHKVIIKQIHQSLKAIAPLVEHPFLLEQTEYFNYYEGIGQGPNIFCYPVLQNKASSSKPKTDLNITLEEGEIAIKKWDIDNITYKTIATIDLHDTDYLPKTIKHIEQGMAEITREYQNNWVSHL